MVRIAGFHPTGPGSIPGNGIIILSYRYRVTKKESQSQSCPRYRVIKRQSHKDTVTEAELQIKSQKETESQSQSCRYRVIKRQSNRN